MLYIFSHKSCADGSGAAWAAWSKFGDQAKYYFKHYGDPVGDLAPNSEIYIVDFSFPKEVLLDLVAQGHKVQVLDHHKSAQADLADLPFALFDMNKSGCRLAWEFFHPGKDVPKLLLAVEDRDLWRFKYPDTKAISAYLGTIPWTFEEWSKLAAQLELDPERVVAMGDAVHRYQERTAEDAAAKADTLTIAGFRVKGKNQTHLISEVGNKILEKFSDTPFSATYFLDNNFQFIFSLRSRGNVDVSEIAKKFGGGGHASAAGFKVPSIEAAA